MYPIIVVMLLSWSPAVNLGIPNYMDSSPQSVRWQSEHTCIVWMAQLGVDDYEIFSRFMIPDAPFYSDTFRITNNATNDFHPSVAYDKTRHCFWCAWMGADTNSYDISVCQSASLDGWLTPSQITDDLTFDENPSVCVIRDTVWVAWEREFGTRTNIFVSFYDGVIWSTPYAITHDSTAHNINPKINGHYNHPLVVWQRINDVYYCERIAGIWQSPLPVTTDPGLDMKPEIAVQCNAITGYNFGGAWIFWWSERDGNEELYMTSMDTFNINRRVTINPAVDQEPSPLDFISVIGRPDPSAVAFTTTRNGSQDIYTLLGFWGWDTIPVDTLYSLDESPCMSGGDWRVWVFWQSDRSGIQDIYASQMWVGGIEENASGVAMGDGNILTAWPNPFVGNTLIKFQISNSKLQMKTNPPRSMADQTTLKIYDATGRPVRRFSLPTANYLLPAAVTWDGTGDNGQLLAPGVYLCTLRQGERAVTKKLIKIK